MNQKSERERITDDPTAARLERLESKITRQQKKIRRLSFLLSAVFVMGAIGASNVEWVKSAYAATTAVLMNSTNTTDGMTSLMSSLSGFPAFFVSNSNTSSASTGILGSGSGGATGIKGTSSTGSGVMGTSSSASGGTGVYGVASGGVGVYAQHTSNTVEKPALRALNLGQGPAIDAESSGNYPAAQFFLGDNNSYGGGQIILFPSAYTPETNCDPGSIRMQTGSGTNPLLVCIESGWKRVAFLPD